MAQVQQLSQNLLADQLNHNLHTIIDYITGQSTCSEDWTSQLNEIKETLKPENENNNELEKLKENEEIPESEDGSPGLLLVEWALSSAEKLQVLSGALKHLEFNKALEALESSTSNQAEVKTSDDVLVEAKEESESHTQEDHKSDSISYKEVIRNSTGTFVDTLKLNKQLLDLLLENSVLNRDMVNKILCRPNRPGKVRELMDFMGELGPRSVGRFILALRATEQHNLANILAAKEFI